MRRKTFGVSALTVDDAVANLELLDHDFYLFRNSETGEDNVVARSPDGGYELIEPSRCSSSERMVGPVRPSALVPAVMTTDGAVELLNLGDEPFVFFLDAGSHRGQVVYRRDEGNYGPIVSSDERSAP